MNTRFICRPAAGLLLALLSGALFAFSLPPRNISVLGWVAFLPLLIIARLAPRSLYASCFSMLTGIFTGCILAGRITDASQLGNIFAAFGCLSVVFAFICGFASYGSRRMSLGLWPVLVGALGVTGELIGRYVFPVSVAISQHANPGALHLASYTGIWGVSFIIWFAPAAIIAFAIKPGRMWPALMAVVALLAFVYFIPPKEPAEGPQLRVAAIQASDPFYASAMTGAAAKKARIAVWPEQLMETDNLIPYLAAKRYGVCVVASFIERPAKGKPYNSTRLISPKGEVIARSRKVHLFGRERFEYNFGEYSHPVKCASFTAGLPICFDTEYTDITRRLARDGAQILFVPNSDPNIPNSLFQYLHSAIIPFRAAENGTPIVWAESYSLSVIVDGRGIEIARAPASKTTYTSAVVRLPLDRTFYNRIGDCFAYLCTAFSIIVVVMNYGKKNHRKVETIFI